MSYLVCKRDSRFEYRVYVGKEEVPGKILYYGHKLGVELDSLSQIIDYKIDRGNNIFVLRDYISDGWIVDSSGDLNKNIVTSWQTLVSKMSGDFGNFSKISICKVNI